MMISAGAGGGYDNDARTPARNIGRHIPGNPKFVAQNLPGAGGIRLSTYMYSVAPKDGSVIAAIHRGVPTYPLLGIKQAKYDPAKFTWLGSITNEVSVCAAWHTTSIRTLRDALETRLIVSSQAGSDTEQSPLLTGAAAWARRRPWRL